jgi:hypothetical protein
MKNPFTEAVPVSKKLKILLFGPSGSGKTLAALSFPGVALIDAEGGSDLYAGRPGVNKFSILRAKSPTDLENAIRFIEADGGKTFQTLVIDPISVFYDVQKEAAARSAKSGELGFREWAKINNKMKSIYNSLTNLPVHVVVIARESTEYDTVSGELKKTGVKPDCDKAIPYAFDFVIRLNADHTAEAVKSRGLDLAKGNRLPAVNWSVFEPVANAFVEGETVKQVSEEQATEDALDNLADREIALEFINHWRGQSLTDRNVLDALGVERLSHWTKGKKAADEQVKKWVADQISQPPAKPKAVTSAEIVKQSGDVSYEDADLVAQAVQS